MNMLLMGKKKKEGDLGHVWIAAHFPKRINKQVVQHTNITSSVDKILADQVPNVTYRILGFLLLGVARIYSKKVEYLLIDCNHSLNEMKHISERRSKADINFGGMCVPESSSYRSKGNNAADVPVAESSSKKKCNNFVEAMRTQFSSIILPENFELDAFDLEIVENDSSNDHVRPHLELVLNDARENDRTRYHTFGKEHWDLPARFSDLASTSTSTMITNINLETSAEKFRDRFALDECMDPMVLSESDDDVDHVVIPIIEQGPESNNINASDMISEDREPDNTENDKDPDEECITGQTLVSETTPTDNIIMMKPSPDKSQLSVTINVTPQSKAPVVSDNHKSDFVAIRTPASREYVRGSRKRKCVFDDSIVIPNKEYKEWLLNASDLVRKRRGSIAIIASKKQQSFDCFTQPIIPSFPSDIRSVITKNDLVLIEQEQKQAEHTTPQDLKVDDVGPLDVLEVHEERDEGIAPSTPVSQATSVRFSEIHETSKVNQAEPASSYESEERERSHIRDVEWNENEMEKVQSSLGVNQENVLTAEKWSAVTKRVGGYLHSNFVRREEKGEAEAVKVTEILKQKTKKESARFFYQILVLKTGGYIDVKQEKPYDEISVIQTPKLNEVFGAGGKE